MIYCNKCGTLQPTDEARFCHECGTELVKPPTAVEQQLVNQFQKQNSVAVSVSETKNNNIYAYVCMGCGIASVSSFALMFIISAIVNAIRSAYPSASSPFTGISSFTGLSLGITAIIMFFVSKKHTNAKHKWCRVLGLVLGLIGTVMPLIIIGIAIVLVAMLILAFGSSCVG